MEFNNKKLEKTSKLINYVIAFVLCGFLISLSSRLIYDVDDWKNRPTAEQFEDKAFLAKQRAELDKLELQQQVKKEKRSNIEKTIFIVNGNYKNAKESYDNWLAARKTVGSPREDKEVLSRANELDEYYKTEQAWRKELLDVEDEIANLYDQQDRIRQKIDQEKNFSYTLQTKAINKYELKIFLIRLLFIFPILLLGIFFFAKFRKHKYWPLFLGFVLFSIYAFFFGLVPYLPSYGGYVRNTVGIILVVFIGIYIINKIKKFIEFKKSELKVPTTERAKNVQIETAEKALDNHMCPSCGKDFIVKKWDKSISVKKNLATYGLVTNFCRFCGLELFKKCEKCDCENFAHLPYCNNCGHEMSNKEEVIQKPD